jgi:hypothetical protein
MRLICQICLNCVATIAAFQLPGSFVQYVPLVRTRRPARRWVHHSALWSAQFTPGSSPWPAIPHWTGAACPLARRHLRRTSVQVWTHPDVALVPHDKCGIGQDVSILAERKGMVPTWYPEWGALCPGWGAVHEPWYGFKKRVSPMTKL